MLVLPAPESTRQEKPKRRPPAHTCEGESACWLTLAFFTSLQLRQGEKCTSCSHARSSWMGRWLPGQEQGGVGSGELKQPGFQTHCHLFARQQVDRDSWISEPSAPLWLLCSDLILSISPHSHAVTHRHPHATYTGVLPRFCPQGPARLFWGPQLPGWCCASESAFYFHLSSEWPS